MAQYEMRKATSFERIMRKIRDEMDGPVGFVVVGTDAERNQKFVDSLVNEWKLLRVLGCGATAGVCVPGLQFTDEELSTSNFLVKLSPQESVSHTIRHGFVKAVRCCGAQEVVLFHIKAASAVELLPGQSLPTSDDVDYLVEVSNF